MTIKDYLGIIRQRLLLTVIVIALTTFSAIILALRQPPQYLTKAKMEINAVGVGSEFGDALSKDLRFQEGIPGEIEILKGEEVAVRVLKRLRLNGVEPSELLDKLTVGQIPQSKVILIEVRAETPELAKSIADLFMQEYNLVRLAQARKRAQQEVIKIEDRIASHLPTLQKVEAALAGEDPDSARYLLLKSTYENTLDRVANLEEQRQKLADTIGLDQGPGVVINKPSKPIAESSSDPLRTGVLGFIIGLPLALGLALLLDSMTDTVRSKEEAEKLIGSEVLGLIPYQARRNDPSYVVSREAPYSSAAEAYRTLRINLESVTSPDGRRILVTSPGMGEGKTSTAANLGVAFSEAGRSALMVSADLRRPRLHHAFGVDPAPGLSDVLKGEIGSTEAVEEVGANLYLLPSGNAEARPDQLLNGMDLKGAIDMIGISRSRKSRPRNQENGFGADSEKDQPDTKSRKIVGVQPQAMLFDAPPVLGAAEVSALGSAVDGVLLTIHLGITRRQAATRAAEQIRRTGGKIIGVVLIGVRSEKDYTPYQPEIDITDGDSTWSKVVSGIKEGS